MNTFRVSKDLVQDQDQHCVCPDLGSNCSQKLSADDKSGRWKGELKKTI